MSQKMHPSRNGRVTGVDLEDSMDGEDIGRQDMGMEYDDALGSPAPSPEKAKSPSRTKMGPIAEIPTFRGGRDEKDSNAPTPSRPPPDTKNVLAMVEAFLLPRVDKTTPWRRGPTESSAERANMRPEARLLDVLYQVALADHIRQFQTMYRDPYDEIGLCPELREEAGQTKPVVSGTADDGGTNDHKVKKIKEKLHLPTHALTKKMTEGRVRACALSRLCYGENSLAMMRATVDLAASYAMQGMWEQVSERLAVATGKLVNIVSKEARSKQLLVMARSRAAAAKVACTFRTLRSHAVANRGQITRDVLRELAGALSALTNTTEEEFLLNEGVQGDALSHPTQLVALLHGFFARFSHPKHKQHRARSSTTHAPVPSWGQVVDYLRHDCGLMKAWLADMEAGVLPQNLMALHVPFAQGDSAKRGICHPMQVSYLLGRSPTASKILSGTTLCKQLQACKVEMPMWINPHSGELKKIAIEEEFPVDAMNGATEQQFDDGFQLGIGRGNKAAANSSSARRYVTEDEHETPTQTVLYELPVLWEEVEALHVLELDVDSADLLKCQLLTLLGVSHIFSNKLSAAEDNMKEALRLIEALGLEQEPAACELYNSIAQLMIVKQRMWQNSKKSRAEKEAVRYMATETGNAELKALYVSLREKYLADLKDKAMSDLEALMEKGVPNAPILSKEEREELQAKAQNAIMRQRIQQTIAEDNDPSGRVVEAAFRYLIRAYEIVTEKHGVQHPSSGTASLAVASVQSTVRNYEDAREWLARALRSFEKLDPVPHRAISFTQVQLSQVLAKQGYADEALCALDKAAQFHVNRARDGIAEHAREQAGGGFAVFVPVLKGSAVHDHVTSALTMATKLGRMLTKRGGKWQACEQAEVAAQIAEGAFGWDSLITGEVLRDLGTRCASILDWSRSASAFKRARDAFEAVNGKQCKKALLCTRSYNRALIRQEAALNGAAAAAAEAQTGPKPQTDSPPAVAAGVGGGGGSMGMECFDGDGDGLSAGEAVLDSGWNGGDDGGSLGSGLTESPVNTPPDSPQVASSSIRKGGIGIQSSLPGMLTP